MEIKLKGIGSSSKSLTEILAAVKVAFAKTFSKVVSSITSIKIEAGVALSPSLHLSQLEINSVRVNSKNGK